MPRQLWSQSFVVESIKELRERGEPLGHGRVSGAFPRLLYAAERYFGSWGSALAAAGVDIAEVRSASKASRAEKVIKWSNESIIEQIREVASRGERMAGPAIRLRYPALYHAAVSERYFGSWRKALQEAGLEANMSRSRSGSGDEWRVNLLLDRIRELKEQYGNLTEELARAVCPEIVQAAEERFGDWGAAVEMARQ